MRAMNTPRGLLLLSAVASLSAFAGDKGTSKAAPKADPAEKVRCQGINECKGKGECGSATYDCAGNNECKGKGWVSVTAKECTAKKGTVLK